MPRRLLPLAAAVLAAGLVTGCADDADQAARIGDKLEVSDDALLDEVDQWAQSPTLIEQLGAEAADSIAPGSYPMSLVDLVLTNRIRFDAHGEQFKTLGLEVSQAELDAVRGGLFPDPTTNQKVLDELDPEFVDRLVGDVARQSAVIQAMGEDYEAWSIETFADVDVSSRYGTWNKDAAAVTGPVGPTGPSGSDPFATG